MNLFSGAKIWCPLSVLERVRITEGFFQKISQQERVYKHFQYLSKMVGRGGLHNSRPSPNAKLQLIFDFFNSSRYLHHVIRDIYRSTECSF